MSKLTGPDRKVHPTIHRLAELDDFHLSRILAEELGGNELGGGVMPGPGKLSPLAFVQLCTQVTLERYEIQKDKQRKAQETGAALQAGFNQVLRNQNFVPRTLMQAVLKEGYGKEQLKLIHDLLNNPNLMSEDPENTKKRNELLDLILKGFPPQAIEALAPMYKSYLENENEENKDKKLRIEKQIF